MANTGDDANNGRSINSPFRSLSKINSLALLPGDTVLLRRGDLFRGSLVIRRSGSANKPIVFDAYGSGPKPILSGSVPVTSWRATGTTSWQASCPDCGSQVTGLYRNSSPLPLGRYPNSDAPNQGYLTVLSHVGTTQLTSQQPLTLNWTGAEVVVRPTHWIMDRATITKQIGNVLTLATKSTYQLTDDWGYFIQNHPATLDQAGEWYYDAVNKTIRLYEPKGNPNQQSITVTTVNRGVEISNASFISLHNLHVTETLTESLLATNVSNLTLTDNEFINSGEDGVIFMGSGSNILIDNCRINDINNNGFQVSSYQNLTLRNSTVRRVGILPGRGKSGDGQYNGLQSLASSTLIENNVIDSIGYNGITFWNNTTIQKNVVSNFCMTKSDGGGIYGWNGNKLPMSNIKIASNIIYNGIGTVGGTSDSIRSGANGIFLDDCVQGTELADNTIFNCQGLGIYLHAVSTSNLLRNTCFNNSISQLYLYNNSGLCQTRQNTVKQNIFLSTLPNQFVAGYSSGANDLASYGLFSYNYYARPFDDAFTIRAVYNQTIGADLALSQWQAQFGQDITSKTSPITYKDYYVKRIDPINRINSVFDTNAEGWDTWSSNADGRAVWDNTNRLDKGSLRVEFSAPEATRDAYVLVYKNSQAVTRAKSYLLQFDAIATTGKKVDVFIRQRDSPYQDVTRRYDVLVGPTRNQYELAFTALADEANALLTFQTSDDGQPLWLDNVRLQEATISPVNPADYVRLVYNPSANDSLITLSETYRDVKNHYYSNRLTLKPFSSVILLKDSLPPVDVRLSLQIDPKPIKTGEVASITLRLHNEYGSRGTVGNRVQWVCQLPASLTVVNKGGLQYRDSVLTGSVQHLTTDTTFVFQVKSAIPGTYSIAAQVTATTYADPDSTPDSGLNDGEDDTALSQLVVNKLLPTDTTKIVTAITDTDQPASTTTETSIVFPNPTTDSFIFLAERPVQSITVIDLLGRERLRFNAVHRAQPVRFGDQLPAGQYFIRILYTDGDKQVVNLLKAGH